MKLIVNSSNISIVKTCIISRIQYNKEQIEICMNDNRIPSNKQRDEKLKELQIDADKATKAESQLLKYYNKYGKRWWETTKLFDTARHEAIKHRIELKNILDELKIKYNLTESSHILGVSYFIDRSCIDASFQKSKEDYKSHYEHKIYKLNKLLNELIDGIILEQEDLNFIGFKGSIS